MKDVGRGGRMTGAEDGRMGGCDMFLSLELRP